MFEAPSLSGTNSSSNFCWTRIVDSKWTDAVLLTAFVALLIIGIAASTGAFNAIGTTNAAYLSYSLYGGAALFLIAEISKLVRNYCIKDNCTENSQNREESESRTAHNLTVTPTIPNIRHSEPLSPETIQNLKEQAEDNCTENSQNREESESRTAHNLTVTPTIPNIRLSEPLSPETIQNLKEQAETYASTYARPFYGSREDAVRKLKNYIVNIIDNVNFQEDPITYMQAWNIKRGSTEEYRIPEDDAHAFFRQALNLS